MTIILASPTAAATASNPGVLGTGMVPVAAHLFVPSGVDSDGVITSATYQLQHKLVHDITGLRLVYLNAGQYQGDPGGNPISIKAAAWYPTTVARAMLFDGTRTRTVDPSGFVITDELGLIGTSAQNMFSKTYVSVSAGQVWPYNVYASGGSGIPEGFDNGSDKTMAGTVTQQDGGAFGPLLVLGRVPGRVPVITLVSDSRGRGQGDDQGYTHRGYFNRAFADTTSMINLSQDGESIARQVDETFATHLRWSLMPGSTHIIFDLSVNDVIGGGASLATIQANCRAVYARAKALPGVEKVYQSTCTPIESATSGQKTVRNGLNDWWRAGGIANLDGVLGMAAATETTVNSNVWNSTSGTSWSGDGVHPGVNGHAAMAQVLLDAQTAGMFV
jgi:lysophospholipase L1-like esterase